MDIIIELDPAWNIRYVNSAMKDVLDFQPNEVIRRNLIDFIHPDDAGDFFDFVNSVSRSHSPFTVKFRARSNSGFPWVEFVGRYVFDPEGGVRGVVGSIRDIDKRQKVEEKVWETGSKLKAIIHTSPLAILPSTWTGRSPLESCRRAHLRLGGDRQCAAFRLPDR